LLLYRYCTDTSTVKEVIGWPPFGHDEPLTTLEQWKASRHRSLWLVVSNWAVSKRTLPEVILVGEKPFLLTY